MLSRLCGLSSLAYTIKVTIRAHGASIKLDSIDDVDLALQLVQQCAFNQKPGRRGYVCVLAWNNINSAVWV